MSDKRNINNTSNNGNGDEISHEGMNYGSYWGYKHAIYENAGTGTTKPFDINLMTGNNSNNNETKTR